MTSAAVVDDAVVPDDAAVPDPERRSPGRLARDVLGSAGLQGAATLLAALLSLGILRSAASALGTRDFGELATATAGITLLGTLTDLGLATAAVRGMILDRSLTQSILRTTMAIRIGGAILLIPPSLLTAVVVYGRGSMVVTAFALQAPILVMSAAQSALAAALVARRRNGLAACADTVGLAGALAGVVLAGHAGFGLRGVAIALCAGQGIALAATAAAALRGLPPSVSPVAVRAILTTALPLGAILVLNSVYLRADTLLLSVLRGPSSVATYTVAYRIAELAMTIPGFVLIALLPELAALPRDAARRLTGRLLVVAVLAAVPISVLLAVTAPQGLALVAGGGYGDGDAPLRWLSIAVGVSYVNAVLGSVLISIGRQRDLLPATVGVVVINLVSNVALIHWYGAPGAGLAMVLSELASALLVLRVFVSTVGAPPIALGGLMLVAGSAGVAAGGAALGMSLALSGHAPSAVNLGVVWLTGLIVFGAVVTPLQSRVAPGGIRALLESRISA